MSDLGSAASSGKTVAHEFHLEQLKALRGEIDDCIKYLRQIELYAVLGSVAVWTFLSTHNSTMTDMRIAWCAPVLLNGLACLKFSSVRQEIAA